MEACEQYPIYTEEKLVETASLYHNLILEEFIELTEAAMNYNYIEQFDAFLDLVWVAEGLVIALKLPYKEYILKGKRRPFYELMEIFISGDVGVTPQLIEAAIDLAYNLGMPFADGYKEVARSNMSKVMPDGKVHKRADGKVLKPDTFSEPDLRQFFPAKS
jgi:hypothetical protein